MQDYHGLVSGQELKSWFPELEARISHISHSLSLLFWSLHRFFFPIALWFNLFFKFIFLQDSNFSTLKILYVWNFFRACYYIMTFSHSSQYIPSFLFFPFRHIDNSLEAWFHASSFWTEPALYCSTAFFTKMKKMQWRVISLLFPENYLWFFNVTYSSVLSYSTLPEHHNESFLDPYLSSTG